MPSAENSILIFSPTLSIAATTKIANPCFIQWICDPLGYGIKKASVEFSGSWILPKEKGIYKIKIEADSENAVREADSTKGNNKFEATIEVK